MYRRHGQKLAVVFLLGDLTVTAGAWVGAYFTRYSCWPAPHGVPELTDAAAAMPLVMLLAALVYRHCGLYEVHRLKQLPREFTSVCRASGMLFLVAIALMFYRRDVYESRLALALFLALNAVGLLVARRALWRVLAFFRQRGLNYGRALIVGGGHAGRMVYDTILANRWTGLEPIGYVDDPTNVNFPAPRLGAISELGEVVRTQGADHVFVALPLARYGELPAVYKALEDVIVEVQLAPDLPSVTGMRLRALEIDGIAFLSLRESPHCGWSNVTKRAMDLVVGSAALAFAAPLMLLLMLLVKLTSRGPVFYAQERMGLGGQPFRMLKFRSMRVDAESETGPVWARRDDDRCTPLGRCMRRWSLDELPQLLNVLAGDMSLVGPRPEREPLVERFTRQVPNYYQRHQVKAGITGWAQVNGWRGNTSLRRRLECDLFYIAHWSPWLDVKILWLTIWRGFRHQNAY